MLRSREVPQGRLAAASTLFALAVAVYGARLVYLQVLRNAYYLRAAEQNRTQTIHTNAPRGILLDRRGRPLATNRPAFSAIFLPSRADRAGDLQRVANDLAPHLHREPAKVMADLLRAAQNGLPVRLAENLGSEEMFRLSELKTRYVGIDLVLEARRHYPHGSLASHLLGYLGAMDPRSWEELRSRGYRADSWVGRAGVEKLFEKQLRGLDGGVQLEVDAQGRLQRVLRRVRWSPGGNARLTLDLGLQKAAEEGLAASPSGAGAVVAVDPRDGDVLVLASLPTFDPNLLLVRQDEEVQESLRKLPELNLALQGAYAPGSVFKIITAAAALNEGRIRPEDHHFCPGYYDLRTRTFLCWKPEGHGRMDFLRGIAHSCDVYFYNIGLKTGGEIVERYQEMFRVGLPTHLALPGERKGHRFGPQQRGRRGWWNGDTLNLSIGQGELLMTPVQVAVMMGAVANGGTFWRPNFVQQVEDRFGRVVYERRPEPLSTLELKASTWDLLRHGLQAVVEEGTGKGVRVEGVDIRGKTGTAENPLGEDHAWFAAYAGLPGREPELALAVLVQHGGHGASAAGPVARKVIEAAFRERPDAALPPAPAPAAFPLPVPSVPPGGLR